MGREVSPIDSDPQYPIAARSMDTWKDCITLNCVFNLW